MTTPNVKQNESKIKQSYIPCFVDIEGECPKIDTYATYDSRGSQRQHLIDAALKPLIEWAKPALAEALRDWRRVNGDEPVALAIEVCPDEGVDRDQSVMAHSHKGTTIVDHTIPQGNVAVSVVYARIPLMIQIESYTSLPIAELDATPSGGLKSKHVSLVSGRFFTVER